MNKKQTIHYDCTKLVQLMNAQQYNGILRADVEYLRHILKRADSFDVCGIFEATKKDGDNYLVHIPKEVLLNISEVFDGKWFESSEGKKKRTEIIGKISSKIRMIIENFKAKKDTRVDVKIFDKNENKSLYVNCSFFSILNPDGHAEQIFLSGLHPVYIIYDLLPLEYPEYFWTDEIPVKHLKIINAMASNNAQLVAISEDVKVKLERLLEVINIQHKEIRVARCGVSEVFLNKNQ